MALTVHDHRLNELTVDAVRRQIRLLTSFPEREGPDFNAVTFEFVDAYVFRGDGLGTILFDIEECDALELYREYATEMQRTATASGGHASWTENEASAATFLSNSRVRGFRIESSIGMEGAVWAKQLVIRSIGRPA